MDEQLPFIRGTPIQTETDYEGVGHPVDESLKLLGWSARTLASPVGFLAYPAISIAVAGVFKYGLAPVVTAIPKIGSAALTLGEGALIGGSAAAMGAYAAGKAGWARYTSAEVRSAAGKVVSSTTASYMNRTTASAAGAAIIASTAIGVGIANEFKTAVPGANAMAARGAAIQNKQ